jgi:hypothetical protein
LNHEKFAGEDDAAFEGMIKFCGEFEKSTDFLQDQGSTMSANATDLKGVVEQLCEYCGKPGHFFDKCHSLAHPSQYPIYLKGEGKEDKVKAYKARCKKLWDSKTSSERIKFGKAKIAQQKKPSSSSSAPAAATKPPSEDSIIDNHQTSVTGSVLDI